MPDPEIILNLWYIHDDMDIIYSLRVRLYIMAGTDEEKLAYLQAHAGRDYLIARMFPIPKSFYFRDMAVAHRLALEAAGNPLAIFEEALRICQNDLPSQTPQDIPQRPLFCLTPLFGTNPHNIRPEYSGQIWHR